MSDEALKPCPFCGGEAQVMCMDLDSIDEGWKVWGVWCVPDLHAEERGGFQHGHFIDNCATKAEAIAAWNTRHERTCELVGSYYYDEYDQYEFEFSCGHSVNSYDKEPPNYCPDCGAKVVG